MRWLFVLCLCKIVLAVSSRGRCLVRPSLGVFWMVWNWSGSCLAQYGGVVVGDILENHIVIFTTLGVDLLRRIWGGEKWLFIRIQLWTVEIVRMLLSDGVSLSWSGWNGVKGQFIWWTQMELLVDPGLVQYSER